jgi:hypothetical protein
VVTERSGSNGRTLLFNLRFDLSKLLSEAKKFEIQFFSIGFVSLDDSVEVVDVAMYESKDECDFLQRSMAFLRWSFFVSRDIKDGTEKLTDGRRAREMVTS